LKILNISSALAALFDCLREVNPLLDEDRVSTEDAKSLLAFFKKANQILGVLSF